eukprot:5024395-Pyramimonas_sp.AAC.1
MPGAVADFSTVWQARDAAAILEEAALLLPLHTGVYYAPPYITAMVQVDAQADSHTVTQSHRD